MDSWGSLVPPPDPVAMSQGLCAHAWLWEPVASACTVEGDGSTHT